MQHDEFVGQVQGRAHLPSRAAAERATRATLETLAERTSGGAADNLSAQLPHEIGEHLRRHAAAATETGESFSFDEFLARVAEREGVDLPDAAFHARIVLDVTGEATTGAVMQKVREQLPEEYDRLFT